MRETKGKDKLKPVYHTIFLRQFHSLIVGAWGLLMYDFKPSTIRWYGLYVANGVWITVITSVPACQCGVCK